MTVPLTGSQPDTTGWTVLDVSAGGSFTLDANIDYILDAGGQPVLSDGSNGALRLRGGRNLLLKAAHLRVQGLTRPGELASTALMIQEHPNWPDTVTMVDGRTIWVEGILIDGDSLGQAIRIWAPSADVWIQNLAVPDTAPVRFFGCDHRDGTNGVPINHPDLIQPYGAVKSLRINGFTGHSAYQGIFLKEDNASTNAPVYLSNVNLEAVEVTDDVELDGATGYNYAGHRMFALYPNQAGTVHVDSGTFWVKGHPNNGWAGGSFRKVRYWDPNGGDGGGFTSSRDLATWDGDTQSWVGGSGTALGHSTTTVHSGGGALALTQTFGAGWGNARAYSSPSLGGSNEAAHGSVLGVWVYVPAGSPGVNWRAAVGIYDEGSVIRYGPDAAVAPGTWTWIGADSVDLTGVNRWTFRIGADDVNATLTVYADSFQQGSLSDGAAGAYVDDPVLGTGTDADAVSVEGVTKTQGSDATGQFVTFGSDVVSFGGTGQGKIYLGSPPDGDYVAAADVGIGYVTPSPVVSDVSDWSNPISGTTAGAADVVAPVITAGPSVSGVTDTSATIVWTTDELSDSEVEYADFVVVPQVSVSASPPIVSVGATITLQGTLVDDGGDAPSYMWTQLSGSGEAVFANASALSTTVTVNVADSYVFRLFATNSAGSYSADTDTVTVVESGSVSRVRVGGMWAYGRVMVRDSQIWTGRPVETR